MTAANSTAATVELPVGVEHWTSSGRALSWEAYDALTEDDGWSETTMYDERTGEPRHWKHGEIGGRQLTIHAPREPRLAEGGES